MAGSCTGAAEQCQQDRAQIRPAILPHAGNGGRRNRAARRIADHPQRREGQAMGGGEARCDMGFHVDGERAGRRGQRLLIRLRHNRQIDAREIADAGFGQAGGQTLTPGRIRRPALAASDNRPREDRRARRQRRIEAAGDAEAEDARGAVGDGCFDEQGKPRPAGRQSSNARPPRDRRLAGEAGNRKDETGRAPAHSCTAHSPYSTARVLPLVRLR